MSDNKELVPTTIRFEPDTLKLLKEVQEHFSNTQSGAVNFCIKEYHSNIFKKP